METVNTIQVRTNANTVVMATIQTELNNMLSIAWKDGNVEYFAVCEASNIKNGVIDSTHIRISFTIIGDV